MQLVDVAMNAGFADQPHMNRGVRQLSGLTPGVGERKFVQDFRIILSKT